MNQRIFWWVEVPAGVDVTLTRFIQVDRGGRRKLLARDYRLANQKTAP
jgi:hypothetical protein